MGTQRCWATVASTPCRTALCTASHAAPRRTSCVAMKRNSLSHCAVVSATSQSASSSSSAAGESGGKSGGLAWLVRNFSSALRISCAACAKKPSIRSTLCVLTSHALRACHMPNATSCASESGSTHLRPARRMYRAAAA
eukprot:scaffold175051_cov27-Tisochrysis_lutea.AAC.4